MKKLCISTIILAFLIGNLFSLDQTTDEKVTTLAIPMGISMQISSGIMHDRVILRATSEEERPIRNRDYDNKVITVGKIITFTGLGAFLLGGVLLIAIPVYFIYNRANPDVEAGLLVGSLLSGSIGLILLPPGGITWIVGRAIQNVRDKKQTREAEDEINVSYNTFSKNFQSIINIPR